MVGMLRNIANLKLKDVYCKIIDHHQIDHHRVMGRAGIQFCHNVFIVNTIQNHQHKQLK